MDQLAYLGVSSNGLIEELRKLVPVGNEVLTKIGPNGLLPSLVRVMMYLRMLHSCESTRPRFDMDIWGTLNLGYTL